MQMQGKMRMGRVLQVEGRVKCEGPRQSASKGLKRRGEQKERKVKERGKGRRRKTGLSRVTGSLWRGLSRAVMESAVD